MQQKIWQVVLKGCWTVVGSLLSFYFLLQKSHQQLGLFYADLFVAKQLFPPPKTKKQKKGWKKVAKTAVEILKNKNNLSVAEAGPGESDPGLTSHPGGSAASSTLSHLGVRQHSDEVMENGRGESGPSLLAAEGKVSVSEAAQVAGGGRLSGGGAGLWSSS